MKAKSLVWRCFERVLNENQRTEAVICQLCDNQYKFFGNTTNLKVHLEKKHPIQWDLLNTGHLEEVAKLRLENAEDTTPPRTTPRKRTYKVAKNHNEDSPIDSDQDQSEDHAASMKLVQQMHGDGSDEEWLEEDPFQTSFKETYLLKPKKAKTVTIKREVVSPRPRRSSAFYQHTPVQQPERSIIVKDTSHKDEFSVFGEYVANKLRKFKAPRTRGNLQQLITTLLWQGEYGLYDDAEAVKRLLMTPMETTSFTEEQDIPIVHEIQQTDQESNTSHIIEVEHLANNE